MKSTIILFLFSLSCFFALYRLQASHEVPPVRTYIIGLDGASWNLMRPLMQQGKLPNLSRLKKNGVSGDLKSAYPAHSAFLWTTIATGKTKEKHGIGDFTTKEEDGEKLNTQNLRRVKAFWNMLSERDISVSVVNWWVTWPPENVNGTMVSDRYRLGRHQKLKFTVTHPPELQNQMPQPIMSRRIAQEEWKLHGIEPVMALPNNSGHKGLDKLKGAYPQYWCQDAAVLKASKYLLEKHPAQVFAVVFRVVDVSSHFMWGMLPKELLEEAIAKYKSKTLTPADFDRYDRTFSKIVEPVYIYADWIVGEIVKSAPEGSNFLIVSDHGFGFDQAGYTHTSQAVPPPGIMILSGNSYKKNKTIQGATIYDITPTLLHQFGLPVAKDFDGRPLLEAFEKTRELASIATWENVKPQTIERPVASEVDEEAMEDLKALGYIQN